MGLVPQDVVVASFLMVEECHHRHRDGIFEQPVGAVPRRAPGPRNPATGLVRRRGLLSAGRVPRRRRTIAGGRCSRWVAGSVLRGRTMETPADEGGRRGSHCRPLEPNATSRRPCSAGFERGRPRGAQDPSRRSSSGVLSRGGRSVRLEGPLDGADPVPTRPRSLPGERRCRPSSRHSPRRPGGRRRESRGRGPPPLGHARRGEEGRDRRAASSGRARLPSSPRRSASSDAADRRPSGVVFLPH